MRLSSGRGTRLILFVVFLLGFCATTSAVRVPDRSGTMQTLIFVRPELAPTAQHLVAGSDLSTLPEAIGQDWAGFLADNGQGWRLILDQMSGRVSMIEGQGIPWIPGKGNNLSGRDLGLDAGVQGKDVPEDVVAARALELVQQFPDLFGVPSSDLQLNRRGSGPLMNYLYIIDFNLIHNGIPVEQAHVVFRINHGNLIQFGQESVAPSVTAADTEPSLGPDEAWNRVWQYIGGDEDGDETVEPAHLVLTPVYNKVQEQGRIELDYALVYLLSFQRKGITGTFQARVDAHSGEVLSFTDTNDYGHIQGGVELTDNYPNDTVMPFPYANYSGTNNFANGAGDFPGTTGTSTLVGQYTRMTDYCGTISKASDGTGLINFGTNTGNDCSTPGTGGAGNTRAARTQYWHVTSVKLKALTYMPSNNWLNNQLEDRVNLTSAQSAYCPGNAWWDGTRLNFCVSGGGYGNTGQLPGVSLHEWGHGMDENDGRNPADEGTGESYGDFTGVLQTHQSCVGAGFTSQNCDGYGDSCRSCKGVRDIDWDAHADHNAHTPFMLDDTDPNSYTCRWWAWPQSYAGPCRYEGHCESYIPSEACWDLAARELPAMGIDTTTSWQIMDRLWYASRSTAQSAYSCSTSSGTVLSSDGGNTGSLYNIFRAVDDCDGNLNNGTPHAAAIFAAMAAHNIAVGSAGDATNQNQTNCCPTLATPSLNGSAGAGQDVLTWGAVTNATRYFVYRNEVGCSAGFTKIATVTATSYTDTNVSGGTTYYYRIQAATNSDACTSAMSNCVTLTPTPGGGPCTAPGAPTLNSAVGSCTGVDLSWTAGSGTTLSYNIYRKTGTCGGTYTRIAGPIGTTTTTDTTATAGTTYAYVIRGACDSEGTTESANSNCLTASPLGTVSTPAAPSVTDDCAGLIVSWTADPYATSYNVLRRNNGCGNNGWSTVQSGVTGTSWTDATAATGSTYGYYIQAVNDCGTAGDKANCTSATHNAGSAPSPPTGLTATPACASIGLTWNASTGAASYNVLRTTNSNCSTGLAQIGTSAATTFTDGTAVTGTTYYYVVQAVNGCGTSSNSSCANAARLTVPAAPTGVSSTGTCTGVTTSWNNVTGATSYNLLRGGACGTMQNTFTNVTSPHADTSAVAGTTYNYWVVAVNSCGNSANSSCSSGARLVSPTPSITGPVTNTCPSVSVTLTTEAGMSDYQWYRDGTPIGGATAVTYVATQTGSYTVSYTGANGCSGTSAAHAVTITACVPNIVYFGSTAPVPLLEDGDGVMEAGEKWQINVTVQNTGGAAATAVLGTLAGDGIVPCDSPGDFGDIPAGGTASHDFIFYVDTNSWYGTYACGSTTGFDLVGKSSNGGAYNYISDMDFAAQQVGQLGGTTNENAAAPDISNAKNGSKSSTFAPAFALTPTVTSAVASMTLSGHPDPTTCVMVELVAPGGAASTLKPYGTPLASPYNVTVFYNARGAGAYVLRVSEASGCGGGGDSVDATGIAMSVTKNLPDNCDSGTASCSAIAPEVSDDSAHYLKVTKESNPALVHVLFEDVSATNYNLYVSKTPNSHPFLVTVSNEGKKDCAVPGSTPAAGGMRELINYSLETGIAGSADILYFIVTADNGAMTEGSLGRDSALVDRTADSYCNR
jgi:fibronectin type 3 domain-containing protein